MEKLKNILYRDKLDPVEKSRYMDKIRFINDQDPLDFEVIKTWTRQCEELLPAISYFDIVNYLVYGTSTYTQEQFKCYKGLEAYNQFVCGWVSDRAVYQCADKKHVVVSAKVLHSQRMREKALRPWIVAENDGVIVFGHCDCQAGCGEVCTHIAALLFSIDATVRIRQARTVTEKAAYWKLPPEIKKIDYNKLADIDFTSAKTLKKNLDKKIESVCDNATALPVSLDQLPTVKDDVSPTDTELSDFFKSLHETGTKPVLLSTIEPYSASYIPCLISEDFPKVLSTLYNEKLLTASHAELSAIGNNISITVSDNQSKEVEKATRLQYKTKVWNRFRAGRITASRAKAVCRTNPSKPSISLVKSVCYPEENRFSNAATRWGCEHEEVAKAAFVKDMEPYHEHFTVKQSGLLIHPAHPYLGASPDAMVSCECCGTCVIEIKCPFCVKDKELSEISYLLRKEDGQLSLDRKHSYYYQVQTQLGVSGLEICYFIVWSEQDMHVERIAFDRDVFTEICDRSKHFFQFAVLPELMGKFFSRASNSYQSYDNTNDQSSSILTEQTNDDTSVNNTLSDKSLEKWCYCKQGEYGLMIFCENENCSIQWFHFKCVGVKKQPKGQWFCSDCRPRKPPSKRVKKTC